jgi:hypothetical protein
VQFGFDRCPGRCAFEDSDGGQATVGQEIRLLDGQSPVKLGLSQELPTVAPVGEMNTATAADAPRYGAAERDVGLPGCGSGGLGRRMR